MYTGRVNPTIVKIEQSANCNDEVDNLVVPTVIVERLHIVWSGSRRIVIHLVNESK
jgi:hypothetical protein